MTRRAPTLQEVVGAALGGALADVHVALPAKVVRYDSAKQKADVQPLLRAAHLDESEQRVVESLPVVPNVPVVFPGAGGYRVTFPLQVDDTVLLILSEGSLDKWLEQGGEVDPLDDRRFSLADGIAIPGLRDFAHALGSAPTDRMTIGQDAGLQIHIDGTGIRIGTNAAGDLEPAVLGDTLETRLATLESAHNTHKHPTAATGPASLPDTVVGPGANIKSSAVKVKK